ncbi:TonB family protein [Phyllobacterium sp. SYP-B3895]|uniref:TonB family protein n=1 Tax=Phyllobacterium sp. SYP-B3895 TaxID=2663240 RepID=UPI00129953D2|nr:energy transducer TonB [Phyllobacterium sp. SYP-B3895]MRG57609.1 TonB family protein [Phyllobacterium sp. SYP-B3895]
MSNGSGTAGGGGPRLDWREVGLWSAAGLVVVALHAGGAWYLQSRQSVEPAGDIANAIIIDMEPLPAPIVPEPVAPEAQPIEPEPTEPEAVEQEAASPEALPEVQPEPEEQVTPVEEAEPVEEVTPEPVQEQAEEVVELPNVDVPLPVVRPEPEKPDTPKKEKAVRRPEPKTAVARTEAETPRQAVQQPQPAASSAASARQAEKWSSRVQAYLIRRTRSARTSGEGTVRVSFTVTRDGDIVSARIVGSSGNPILDQGVLDAVRRASPVPSAPANVTVSRQSFTVPFLIR